MAALAAALARAAATRARDARRYNQDLEARVVT